MKKTTATLMAVTLISISACSKEESKPKKPIKNQFQTEKPSSSPAQMKKPSSSPY